MYEPNKEEELLLNVLKDLGYWSWWDGYNVISNSTSETKNVVKLLINKGWITGDSNG
jgi:hypothetical protein